jgi:hypothetical protein
MDLMSERGAFFDLTSSRSVAYDTVISTSDRVEIPVDAPLAMPVQPLAFWQGQAKPAATAPNTGLGKSGPAPLGRVRRHRDHGLRRLEGHLRHHRPGRRDAPGSRRA